LKKLEPLISNTPSTLLEPLVEGAYPFSLLPFFYIFIVFLFNLKSFRKNVLTKKQKKLKRMVRKTGLQDGFKIHFLYIH